MQERERRLVQAELIQKDEGPLAEGNFSLGNGHVSKEFIIVGG
jgi:hypothetical protein